MLKNKRILLVLILALALFLIPSICNAADATETTKTSTGATVKWSYDIDGEVIVNLKCMNVSEISGEVIIPSTIDGKEVKSIGNTANSYSHHTGAFEGCTAITSVTIPNTVTNIGSEAFNGCSGLRTINIPDTVVNIGNSAFSGCKITNINIPNNVTTISDSVFRDCVALKEITIPNNVTTIGGSAFRGCVALKQITIPNNVTTIGGYAFEGCSSLGSITLSNNLTELNDYTFSGCTSLTSVVIPDSVSIIRSYASWAGGAFEDCTNLTKVLIPDNVATIEAGAFENCNKLTIYGNDGKTSKKYAEDNKINFDYIANWNKAPVGEDVTPPALKSLMIDYSSAFKKDEGTNYYLVSAGINIAIKATFEEVIYGETAPTLTIKCGNGEKIELTNGSVQGKYIIYTYTIKDKDKGIISAVSMTGGDIADETGNKVEKYTCPELVTSYIIGTNYVYANGKGSATTDEGNNGQNGGNNQGNTQKPSTTVTLSSIAITKTPTRNTYLEGEKFDKSGMVITAKYSDGSTKQITNYSVSPSIELKPTDTKVVISYTENGVTKTVEQKITVTEKMTSTQTVTLSSISITKAPTKTSYTEGEKFDKSGMVITAKYSDGTTKQITNYTFSPSAKLTTSNKNITITYTENGITKNVQQTITVKDPTVKEDNKLPQTGATVLSLALISLIAVAVISKVRYGKYKDI